MLRIKYTISGIVAGILISLCYVGLSQDGIPNRRSTAPSKAPISVERQKDFLFGPLTDDQSRATEETLQRIRRMNLQIKKGLEKLETDNLGQLRRVISDIEVSRAKSMTLDEATFYVSLVQEIALLGFICRSQKIVSMCDDRMFGLVGKSSYKQHFMDSYDWLVGIQAFMLKPRKGGFISTETMEPP